MKEWSYCGYEEYTVWPVLYSCAAKKILSYSGAAVERPAQANEKTCGKVLLSICVLLFPN